MKENFTPDNELIVSLIARLFTRNTISPVERNANRFQLMQNISNLSYNPGMHLGFCLKLMDTYSQEGKLPSFEIGLIMGASIALCANSRENEKILKLMLADITTQQENMQEQEKVND